VSTGFLASHTFLTITYKHISIGVGIGQKGYVLDDWISIPDRGKIFLFSTASRPVLGPNRPPIQWVPRDSFQGVKRPGREADNTPKYVHGVMLN
jgi:hypothetical protein